MTDRITVDELISCLSSVSPVRRRAILFGLETGMPLEQVIALTWKQFYQLDLPPFPDSIARLNPHHIKLEYVFWEALPNGVNAPLFGLKESAQQVSQGRDYETLKRLYDTMILIDREADLLDFTTQFCQELDRQISKT